MTSNLDMLTNEPLELAVALRRLAEGKTDNPHTGAEWAKFAGAMIDLIHDLKALNEPRNKRDESSD